jgi:3-hydroxyacyl-CoA dehydrogenase
MEAVGVIGSGGDLADRDLVIEAVTEHEPAKAALYRELGAIVRPDCVLAGNTSSIPISRLVAAGRLGRKSGRGFVEYG